MAGGFNALLKIGVKVEQDGKGLDAAATGVDKFAAGLGKLVKPAAGALAAVGVLGVKALDAASDLQQAMGGIDSVFGDSADQVKAWSDQAARSVGLSATDYANFATVLGAQFKTAGVPMDQVAGKTDDLIRLGADLAATYGGTTSDAVRALGAAMRGEGDPAERYGLNLKTSAVNALMAAQGTDKLTGAALTAAKAQAVVDLATQQAAGAMGQFARESDTASGSAQISAAAWQNSIAGIGSALLPFAAKASELMAGLAEFVGRNSTLFVTLGVVVGGLAGIILGVAGAVKLYTTYQTVAAAASKVWLGVQWLLNAALTANPVGIVIVAVVALVAAIVLLWNKSEAFRNFFIGVWSAISTAAQAAWSLITSAAQTAWGVITGIWNAIKAAAVAVWNAIGALVAAVVAGIVAVVKGIVAVAAAVWSAVSAAASAAWNAIKAVVGGVVDGIKTAVGGLTSAVGAVWSAISGAASTVWNAIGGVVSGVVDGVKAAWETVTGAVSAVWDRVMGVVNGAVGAIKSAVSGITSVIEGITGVWDSVVGGIQRGVEKVKGWLSGLWSKLTSTPAVATPAGFGGGGGGFGVAGGVSGASAFRLSSPSLTPAALGRAVGGGGGGFGPQIVIQGALDPDAVARQVRGILTGRDRRTSGVRIGGLATP